MRVRTQSDWSSWHDTSFTRCGADCCDGSDEPAGRCKDTCAEAGAVARNAMKAQLKVRGIAYSCYMRTADVPSRCKTRLPKITVSVSSRLLHWRRHACFLAYSASVRLGYGVSATAQRVAELGARGCNDHRERRRRGCCAGLCGRREGEGQAGEGGDGQQAGLEVQGEAASGRGSDAEDRSRCPRRCLCATQSEL